MVCFFNQSKTECITISMKNPSLIFDNVHLKEVESNKHLGISICYNLSWNPHVNEMISKAYAKLGLMRKCKYILDRDSLQTIYFSFMRPALEYTDVIWGHIPVWNAIAVLCDSIYYVLCVCHYMLWFLHYMLWVCPLYAVVPSLYAVGLLLYAVVPSFYAVGLLLYAVVPSLYAVGLLLYAVVPSLYDVGLL